MQQSLTAFLAERARTHGDHTALVHRDDRITYRELATESRRVARGLADLGIGPGDRVALWLPNVPAWLACFFACAQLGAIAVAVNTRFRSGEISDIVGRSGARVLVFWPDFRHIDFAGILRDVDPQAITALETLVAYDELPQSQPYESLLGRRVLAYRELAGGPEGSNDLSSPDAGCIIFTTSGTTRAPKFVLHPQKSISRHAADMTRAFGFDAPDAVILQSVPLCGTLGLCVGMSALAGTRPLVMLDTFEARAAAQAIRTHGVTHLAAVSDMVAQLLAAHDDPLPYPSVRMIVGARGGQAAPALARGLRLMGTYGMSEVQGMLSRHADIASCEQRELGGGMLVAPEARVRVRDTATGVLLPHGVHGEIEVQVPSAMTGYFGNPEATAAVFTADGYLRTGDLGYTVGEREFVFLSRIGDVLRLAGFLVNPLEIEAVLDAHPAVTASQVVGIDGPRGLQAVAFIVCAPGHTLDAPALTEHCKKRIAGFKVPAHFLAIDAFPFTPSPNGNKIQKAKLREIAAASLNR